MNIQSLRALALLACGAAANASAENAPSTISLDMNFRYELIDLAPDDGLAPSISFYNTAAEVYLTQWSRGAQPDQTSEFLDRHGTASRQVGPNYSTVTGSASGASIEFDLLDRSAYAAARNWFAFTLSPNTRVIFTADYDTAMWIDPSAQNPNATIQFSGWLNDGTNPDSLHGVTMLQGTGNSSGSLSVMADTSTWAAPGELALHATAQVWTMAAPIPEPGHVNMLLAGAVLLGGAALGRRLRERAAFSGLLPSSCRRRSRPARAR